MVVIALVAAAAAGACLKPPPVNPAPTTNPTAGADGPAQVVVLDKPWLPPWAGPNTPPEIAERPGLRFCGVEQGPAIDRAIRGCFVESVTSGRDIDSTQDSFGVPGWSLQFCARITPHDGAVFVLDGCESGPVFR